MVHISRLSSLSNLHQGPISALAVSETSPPFLVSSSKDGTTCFTDLSDPTARFRLKSNSLFVTAITRSPVENTYFLGWSGGFVTEVSYDTSKASPQISPLCVNV